MSHVAYLVPTLDRLAGAERQMLSLAEGFRNRDWRVSVVTLSGNGNAARAGLEARGVSFLSLGMRHGLAHPRGWMRFHRWLRRETPDVVHAHLPHAAWMARWSRLLTPMPVLIDTIHTSDTGGLGRRLGYRLSGGLSDRCSAVSEGVADAWRSAHMVPEERLNLIPNGVDVDRWRPDPAGRNDRRRRMGLGEEFVWFTAGRLDPVKDYPTLLRAMMKVSGAARLIIAGTGPQEGSLRRLAIELGIESRVQFLGFQPDVLPWMQAADAFILASRWEGLPMTLLEAGACALPAVATNVPGSREIVLDGDTGFLVPARDAAALATVMHRMTCLHADARSAMGQNARRHIVARYSLARVLDSWEAMYRNLLDRHPRPARWSRSA
jgi:glycosyltransferase involved in cell wall biosynthesis